MSSVKCAYCRLKLTKFTHTLLPLISSGKIRPLSAPILSRQPNLKRKRNFPYLIEMAFGREYASYKASILYFKLLIVFVLSFYVFVVVILSQKAYFGELDQRSKMDFSANGAIAAQENAKKPNLPYGISDNFDGEMNSHPNPRSYMENTEYRDLQAKCSELLLFESVRKGQSANYNLEDIEIYRAPWKSFTIKTSENEKFYPELKQSLSKKVARMFSASSRPKYETYNFALELSLNKTVLPRGIPSSIPYIEFDKGEEVAKDFLQLYRAQVEVSHSVSILRHQRKLVGYQAAIDYFSCIYPYKIWSKLDGKLVEYQKKHLESAIRYQIMRSRSLSWLEWLWAKMFPFFPKKIADKDDQLQISTISSGHLILEPLHGHQTLQERLNQLHRENRLKDAYIESVLTQILLSIETFQTFIPAYHENLQLDQVYAIYLEPKDTSGMSQHQHETFWKFNRFSQDENLAGHFMLNARYSNSELFKISLMKPSLVSLKHPDSRYIKKSSYAFIENLYIHLEKLDYRSNFMVYLATKLKEYKSKMQNTDTYPLDDLFENLKQGNPDNSLNNIIYMNN